MPRKCPRRRARTLAGIALLVSAFSFGASAQSLPSTGARAVATYESVGLYWANPGGTAGCDVRFRKSGTSAWRTLRWPHFKCFT